MFNRKKLKAAEKLIELLDKQKATPLYVSIRRFDEEDQKEQFWEWAKMLIGCDEYGWLMFTLRELTIGEMVGVSDGDKLKELNARLNMIAIFDRYLQEGVHQNGIPV